MQSLEASPIRLILKTRPSNGLNVLNVWNKLNAQLAQSVVKGVRNVQRLMVSSNPRVGEIKLEEIVDRSIVRKLDDSGFIDRAFAAAGVK